LYWGDGYEFNTTHKSTNPPLDLEVHIHKMVAEAFPRTFKIKGATKHVTTA
jgi:hypothetical protein